MEKYGERTAFRVKNDNGEKFSAITYNEAYSDVQGLGTSLMALSMKDKRIAIIGKNSYEWAVSYLAAICGTGVAVLLDKEFNILEFKQFLIATKCSCAIFSKELEDTFWQIRNDGVTELEILINMDKKKSEWDILSLRELIEDGKQMAASGNQDFISVQRMPNELCTIMFTAGTTGVPKGINLSHLNIVSEIRLVSNVLNISESDVFFSKLPFHCCRECICGILLPLYNGASITPYGGFKYNFEVSAIKGYSITESSSIAALSYDNSSTLRLLPEMKVKIDSPDLKTGIGEICLSGENIMIGYCDNPQLTAQTLKDGWLYTGDLGRIDEKGAIHIVGRKKNIIVAENGKDVYPEELEDLVGSIPFVLESMVWGKDSYTDKASVLAVTIVLNEEKVAEKLGNDYLKQKLEELLWKEIQSINDRLPHYKQIKKMILRKEEFQKNSCQKIIRWYPANRE